MNLNKIKKPVFCAALLVCVIAAAATAQSDPSTQPPADVSGRWLIYAKNPNGSTDEKTVEIKQNGNEITGHFKGPHQSGGIVGTVSGQHIVFRTKTREVLTFRGTVDGDTIRGHFGIQGRHGEFEARRQ